MRTNALIILTPEASVLPNLAGSNPFPGVAVIDRHHLDFRPALESFYRRNEALLYHHGHTSPICRLHRILHSSRVELARPTRGSQIV